jgi:hypothetical protein
MAAVRTLRVVRTMSTASTPAAAVRRGLELIDESAGKARNQSPLDDLSTAHQMTGQRAWRAAWTSAALLAAVPLRAVQLSAMVMRRNSPNAPAVDDRLRFFRFFSDAQYACMTACECVMCMLLPMNACEMHM